MITRKCAINGGPNWLPWTQPVLSDNGTLGGASFACDGSRTDTLNYVWKALDNSASTYYSTRTISTGYLTCYNPTPIKVSEVLITNNSTPKAPASCKVYGSDNGSTWVELASFTNANNTANSQWSIGVNSSTAYKYHRLNWYTAISISISIKELDLVATYQEA